NRDYPLVMGTTMIYGVLLILANLIVDILYAVIDTRIKLAGAK
ncbi:MAG TPA: ABC transporter permease, partial [Bdellovibrionota bacterium]|nr:ABC transporter permease [Bdellovibrionota bacterium]